MSQEIMERARQMRAELDKKRRVITVPELGDEDGPLKIYVRPVSNRELRDIISEQNEVERAAKTIAVRARDEDGNLMFKNGHREIFRNFLPPLMLKISRAINEDMNEMNGEAEQEDDFETAKN